MAYDDPAWEEWDKKARNHYETPERGWSTVREEREKMRYDTPSGRTIYVTDEGFTTKEPKKEEPTEYEVTEVEPKKNRTIKSRIKSKLRKIKSEKPVEIVDVELEAARKKGYDAHKKDQRARELVKAEKQGRREAMTFKSRRVDDAKKLKKGVDTVAEKLEPVGKRVAKNVGKLMGEAKYTAKAVAKPQAKPARITAKTTTTKTTTAKPQTQKKEKPGPAVRKGTLGRHEGGLPVKSHKSGPGRRAGGLPVKSTKPGPGTRSKHGPVARSGYKPPHKSNKPAPTNNIPKATATVNKKRSVNFAMRKRSRK